MELRLLDVAEAPNADRADCRDSLAASCPHVMVDERLASLGYVFYHFAASELPVFFTKRVVADDTVAAITLIGGVDPATRQPVLEDCQSSARAWRRISTGPVSAWRLRVTFGARMLSLSDLTSALALRRPRAFDAIAAELAALGLTGRADCCICRAPAP
jgi:hypothetical protein